VCLSNKINSWLSKNNFRVLSYLSWFPCAEIEVLVYMLCKNCLNLPVTSGVVAETEDKSVASSMQIDSFE
jgi:hypothetical protein